MLGFGTRATLAGFCSLVVLSMATGSQGQTTEPASPPKSTVVAPELSAHGPTPQSGLTAPLSPPEPAMVPRASRVERKCDPETQVCGEKVTLPPGYGDPKRGAVALQQYACISCHMIQGMVGPKTYVGPPLFHLSRQKYIAGSLPNTPQNLKHWILKPQEIEPNSAMPDMGVKQKYVQDMIAYLYSLD